jgi:hypothetical protein
MERSLFTKIADPDPEWFIKSSISMHPLPTEVVVNTTKIVTPDMGRSYRVDLYCRWKNGDYVQPADSIARKHVERYRDDTILLPYDELRQRRDFNGTSYETQAHLYEIWANWGNDGHTDYSLMFWMLHPGKCSDAFERMYDIYYDLFHE